MSDPHLNQSMWGYQQQFRISLDGATDRALDQIGAILSPEAYIVGFAVGGDDTSQVCLEVRDGAEPPFTADDFGGPALEGCNEVLVRTRPDIICQLHASFLEVGCDVLETDTFRSNRITLREYRLADQVLLGQPPGVQARAAAGDVTAVPGEALQHPVQRVVAVGGPLPGHGAADRVAHQEDPRLHVVVPGQGE